MRRLLMAVAVITIGCMVDRAPLQPQGVIDLSVVDSDLQDAETPDSAQLDAIALDAIALDAAPLDAAPLDAAPPIPDTGPAPLNPEPCAVSLPPAAPPPEICRHRQPDAVEPVPLALRRCRGRPADPFLSPCAGVRADFQAGPSAEIQAAVCDPITVSELPPLPDGRDAYIVLQDDANAFEIERRPEVDRAFPQRIRHEFDEQGRLIISEVWSSAHTDWVDSYRGRFEWSLGSPRLVEVWQFQHRGPDDLIRFHASRTFSEMNELLRFQVARRELFDDYDSSREGYSKEDEGFTVNQFDADHETLVDQRWTCDGEGRLTQMSRDSVSQPGQGFHDRYALTKWRFDACDQAEFTHELWNVGGEFVQDELRVWRYDEHGFPILMFEIGQGESRFEEARMWLFHRTDEGVLMFVDRFVCDGEDSPPCGLPSVEDLGPLILPEHPPISRGCVEAYCETACP